ncbi:MAG: S41 family peptidase [Clostridia bacterium]|nr:S41 family peptidase [Clostridia bacterium]
MYIKKSVLVFCAVALVIVTAVVSIGAVNPFGFTEWEGFLQFSVISKLIQKEYYDDVEPEQYVNTALEGIAIATEDPYTRYLWGDSAKEYMEQIEGNYHGIGIYIEANEEDNTIEIVSPIAGTPAEKAGLTTGDKILAVNGTPFTGQQIDDAVQQMRGEAGTTVEITILRKGSKNTENLELTREEIVIPSVESEMLTNSIACIRITQFVEGTADLFAEAYRENAEKGMKQLVIDLRNNPGGLMDEAAEIANMFIPADKLIVYTMNKENERVEYNAYGSCVNLPIVVLTNPGSASASEILTGALKDHGLAHHIGEKTYGKGVVQEVFQVGEESVLSVTHARYFTPNGICIHETGITPDEEISMEWEKYARLSDLPLSEDIQMQAAMEWLNR